MPVFECGVKVFEGTQLVLGVECWRVCEGTSEHVHGVRDSIRRSDSGLRYVGV